MEEYQRVATNVGKGLSVIQEEIHRMRMATKAQVDSLAIERQVRSQSHLTRKQRLPALCCYLPKWLHAQVIKTSVLPSFSHHHEHVCR